MTHEIRNLVHGFKSVVIEEVLHHQRHHGTGAVANFERKVNAHLDRYHNKLAGLRAQGDGPALDDAANQINAIAKEQIDRAKRAGCVEIES
jgi:hypothetical protein